MSNKQGGSDLLIDLVCHFVEKSGGIEKVNEVATALRAMAESGDVRICQFLRGVAANPDGAKQMLANALIGLRLAGLVYERSRPVPVPKSDGCSHCGCKWGPLVAGSCDCTCHETYNRARANGMPRSGRHG